MNMFKIGISLPINGITGNDPKKVFMRDANNGFVVSHNFDTDNPTWELANNGVTQVQAKSATQMLVTPSGEAYVACCNNNAGGAYIAYSPSIGSPFTIFENHATIVEKLGTSTETFITGIACNRTTGQVGYVIGKYLSGVGYTTKLYIGTGMTFSAGATIPGVGGGANNASMGNLTYGNNKWTLTASASSATDKQCWRISGNGLTYESTNDIGDSYTAWHIRAGDTSKLWMFWRYDNRIEYSSDNGLSPVQIGANLKFSATRYAHTQIAVDKTGQYLMAPVEISGSTVTGKSSDGGVTWVSGGDLPANQRSHYYCGDGLKFVAVKQSVYYTKNFGETWSNKTGNLASIISSPSLDLILAL